MKRILCIMLALTMLFALASCKGNEPPVDPELENEVIEETDGPLSEDAVTEPEEDKDISADAETDASDSEKDEEKDAENSVAEKPAEQTKPTAPQKPTGQSKPAAPQKPAEQSKPATPPSTSAPVAPPAAPPAAEKPAAPVAPPANDPPAAEAPSAGDTVGSTLASVWRANSGKSAEEIANAVITHSSIGFAGGVVPVEEGLLTGFDNTEIKGFSSGYMFAPMIGTIPFVGYVFELSDGTDADAFVKTLKNSANPRWNICTEAEQTIVEKNGSKVFFLMCPKSFEE